MLRNLIKKIKQRKEKKVYTPQEVFSDKFMRVSDEIAKRCEENLKKPLPDWSETLRKVKNNEVHDVFQKNK